MEWFFPIDKIEKGASIGLWGAGELGEKIIKWNEKFQYCRLLYVYDKKIREIGYNNVIVKKIEEYKTGEVDYILVAIMNNIDSLKEILKSLEIDLKKVIFMAEGYANIAEKVHYSQEGEDIIICNLLSRLGRIKNINYIDIGANEPFKLSNTYLIQKKYHVSKGVLIEPNPILCEKIKDSRKDNICLNIGIANVGKACQLDFYIFNPSTLSTFSIEAKDDNLNNGYKIAETKKIECRDINTVLEEYFKGENIDLLSIDTEGLDGEIIKSIDYDNYAPTIICTETAGYCMGKDRDGIESIEFLIEKGYVVYADTFLNTIFVKKEKLEEYCRNIKTIFPN